MAGWWSMKNVAARRHPRPERHPGHHLLALGPQPRHHRGPGHLPDRHRHAGRARRSRPSAASPISATPSSTSSSRTAPTSTGRARARWSTSRACCRACPQGVKTELGPDATGPGLGLPVRAGGQVGQAQPGGPALLPGLVPALLPQVGARAWPRWRRSAASAGSTRSTSTRTGCRPTASRSAAWSKRCAAATTKSGGRLIEFGGTEYMVRGRGYARSLARLREHRPVGERERHADPRQGRRPGGPGPGPPARRVRSRRHGRSGLRHRRHAPGRERPRRHRPRQGEASRRSSRACPPGVKIVPIYDRSELIQRAIDNLKSTLIEVILTVVARSSCSSCGTSRAPSSRSSPSRSRC